MVKQEFQKGKKLVFNVTFDEMNIHKWKYCDKKAHKWKDVVDLGRQLNEVNNNNQLKIAPKTLIFMLICINGSFKTSIVLVRLKLAFCMAKEQMMIIPMKV